MTGDQNQAPDRQTTPDVVYLSEGLVPASTRDQAEAMIERLTRLAPRPVIFARVKAIVDENRNPDERAIVQGTIDVSGSVVRAQAADDTTSQAMRALERRLERRLNRLAEKREAANERPPSTPPGTWRSGDLPSARPGFYERPPEEREVIRKKTYSPADQVSIGEAVFDLDVLDHRFFLFTDESDGKSSIVYEDGDGVVLRKVDGATPPKSEIGPEIGLDTRPAPVMSVSEAIARMDVSNEPFVFFVDTGTDRAAVLYRRYDGHYGLVVPASGEG